MEKKISRTFDAQRLRRKELIKKILMKCIKVAINTSKFKSHTNIIDDACRDEINELSLTELDLDKDLVCFSMVF